jgi:hypothetical protein
MREFPYTYPIEIHHAVTPTVSLLECAVGHKATKDVANRIFDGVEDLTEMYKGRHRIRKRLTTAYEKAKTAKSLKEFENSDELPARRYRREDARCVIDIVRKTRETFGLFSPEYVLGALLQVCGASELESDVQLAEMTSGQITRSLVKKVALRALTANAKTKQQIAEVRERFEFILSSDYYDSWFPSRTREPYASVPRSDGVFRCALKQPGLIRVGKAMKQRFDRFEVAMQRVERARVAAAAAKHSGADAGGSRLELLDSLIDLDERLVDFLTYRMQHEALLRRRCPKEIAEEKARRVRDEVDAIERKSLGGSTIEQLRRVAK